MKIYRNVVLTGAAIVTASLAACGDGSGSAPNSNPTSRSATAQPAIAVPLSVIQQAGLPTISGSPAPSVLAGSAYDFAPTASDPAGNTLTFSIQNKPAWASFNIMTGEMTGTPAESDAGAYSDIVISASDGTASAALTAFSIQVASATGSFPATVSSDSTAPSTSAVSTAVVVPLSSVQPISSSSASSSTSAPVQATSTPVSSPTTTGSSGSTSASTVTSSSPDSSATSSSSSSTSGSSAAASSAPAGTSAGGGAIQYPRLSWFGTGGGQNYATNQAALVAYLQHMDVAVIGGNWEGSAAGYGYNRGTLVSSVLTGDGAVTPKIVQYNLADNYRSSVAYDYTILYNQINANSGGWLLWQNASNGTHALNAYFSANSNAWQTNSIDLGAQSKDANGNAFEAAFAKYWDGYYRTGGTADAAPNMSGVLHDNFVFVFQAGAVCGDYLHTGSVLCGNNSTVAAGWRAGQNEWTSWFRSNAPGQFLMANTNYTSTTQDQPNTPYYLRPAADSAPIYGSLDADLNEAPLGENYSVETWAGFEQMRLLQQFHDAAVKSPQFNMFAIEGVGSNGESAGANLTASVGEAFRYAMCADLVISSSTVSLVDPGTAFDSTGSYNALWWFDYFAVNPNTGVALDYATSTSAQIGAARYWLGTAIDSVQTAPSQGKVYARRFRMPNGRTALVLLNPSANGGNNGAAPQTIDLTAAYGGSWTHITASHGTNVGSNASVDNGTTVSSVTVPVGDGVILIQ